MSGIVDDSRLNKATSVLVRILWTYFVAIVAIFLAAEVDKSYGGLLYINRVVIWTLVLPALKLHLVHSVADFNYYRDHLAYVIVSPILLAMLGTFFGIIFPDQRRTDAIVAVAGAMALSVSGFYLLCLARQFM